MIDSQIGRPQGRELSPHGSKLAFRTLALVFK